MSLSFDHPGTSRTFIYPHHASSYYFTVFAMLPRQGERYRLRLATHHSPAGTAVPRTSAYRRNSPSSQWEAVEEVSLSPWGIVASCPHDRVNRVRFLALAMPSSRRPVRRSAPRGIVPVTPYMRLSSYVKKSKESFTARDKFCSNWGHAQKIFFK